jgi:hypothetical protein
VFNGIRVAAGLVGLLDLALGRFAPASGEAR